MELSEKLKLVEWGRLHYSSSPDRGLDNILYTLPFIKDKCPDIHLHVFYGFFNWESAAKSRNDTVSLKRIEEMKRQIEDLKDCVTMHDRVTQPELAKEWKKAWCWYYSTAFTETSCYVPGQLVSTSEGRKAIEKISEDDEVVSHYGVAQKVKETKERHYEGDIIEISSNYKVKVKTTPEHPHLILRGSQTKCYRKNGKCTKAKEACFGHTYKHQGKTYTTTNKCKRMDEEFILEWVEAKDVTTRDYLCLPKLKTCNVTPAKLSDFVDEEYFGRNNIRIQDDIVFDEDFYWLMGIWTAEGSFNHQRKALIFNMGAHLTDDIDRVCSILSNLGLHYNIKPHGTATIVRTYSAALYTVFKHIGSPARHKKIPWWIKTSPLNLLEAFLQGLYAGDGCQINDTAKIEIGSVELRDDIFQCLLRFGLVGSRSSQFKNLLIKQDDGTLIKSEEKKEYYDLVVSIGQDEEFWGKFGYKYGRENNAVKVLQNENFVFVPVRKIELFDYDGPVYNLEVEEDESYCVEFAATHNCITAVEAMASRTPIICSNVAALQTTVGEFGVRVEEPPYSREARVKYIDWIVDKYHNKDKWIEESDKVIKGIKGKSWPETYENYWKPFLD